jgi:hypothetical protein
MTIRRIWQVGDTVYLRGEDALGKQRIRKFYVGHTNQWGSGYVWEGGDCVTNLNPRGQQLCDGFSHLGNTLTCKPDKLLDLIRRQYRAAQARHRREERRYMP